MPCCGWLRLGMLHMTPSCSHVSFLGRARVPPSSAAGQLPPCPRRRVSPAPEVPAILASSSSPSCPHNPVTIEPGSPCSLPRGVLSPAELMVLCGAMGSCLLANTMDDRKASHARLEIPFPLSPSARSPSKTSVSWCTGASLCPCPGGAPAVQPELDQSLHAAMAHPISQLLEAFPLTLPLIFGVNTSPVCISCGLSPVSLVSSAAGCPQHRWVFFQGSVVARLKHHPPVPSSKAVCDSCLNEAPIDNCPRLLFSHPPLDGPPCLINYLPLAVQ